MRELTNKERLNILNNLISKAPKGFIGTLEFKIKKDVYDIVSYPKEVTGEYSVDTYWITMGNSFSDKQRVIVSAKSGRYLETVFWEPKIKVGKLTEKDRLFFDDALLNIWMHEC